MTTGEVLCYVDTVCKNTCTRRQKLAWLWEIETRIRADRGILTEDGFPDGCREQNETAELTLRSPCHRVYPWYLMAMLDLRAGRREAYLREMRMAEAFLAQAGCHFRLTEPDGEAICEKEKRKKEKKG